MNVRMKNSIKERMTELLIEADFFMMPVEWIKDKLLEDLEVTTQLSNEKLIEIIKEDEKFRLFESPKLQLSSDLKDFVSQDELKKMGFCKGPRVMLKERVPTKIELIEFLMNKANQTFETLKKAWDIRPENNQQIEDQLLKALAKSQKLQRELKIVFTEEEQKKKELVV